jgi:hypothetical protein
MLNSVVALASASTPTKVNGVATPFLVAVTFIENFEINVGVEGMYNAGLIAVLEKSYKLYVTAPVHVVITEGTGTGPDICENVIVTASPSVVLNVFDAPLLSVKPLQSNHHILFFKVLVPKSAYCAKFKNGNNIIKHKRKQAFFISVIQGIKAVSFNLLKVIHAKQIDSKI